MLVKTYYLGIHPHQRSAEIQKNGTHTIVSQKEKKKMQFPYVTCNNHLLLLYIECVLAHVRIVVTVIKRYR